MSKFLIRDVHLFDGIDVHAQPQTVQVSDGIIQYVGETTPAILPDDNDDDDLVTIDGKGCTLLPGLIDAHTHVFRGVEQVKGAIVAGVTTVLDMHNEPSNARYMKDLARRCSELPEIFSALHAATIDGGWPRAIVRHTNSDPEVLVGLDGWPKLTTPKSAAAYVAQNKAMGADFIKLMQESGECLTLSPLPAPTQTLQEAVVNAAHAHDLLTFAHATNLRETMLVLEAGVDAMAHQFFDQPHTQQLINAYTTSPVRPFVIPTLTAISSMMGLSTARDWVEGPGAAASNKKLLTESSRHCLCDCMKISRPGCNVQFAYDCIKALKSNGVDIVCGTDSGPSIHGSALGAAMHLEMSLYVTHCGFLPVEALRSATGISAQRLNLTDRGHVAVGKRADLLLVRGDPTRDIADSTNVEKVWKAGVLCER